MSPKRYFIAVVAVSLGLVASAWLLAWWLEPLYGDLTRIGGYAERDYGWNAPMEEFHPLLATFGDWEQPVDVLVLGDSFANLRPHQQWQNWLAARTGWRIHTLDKHLVDINELTASPLYRKHPPRVVIWNNIERDLKDEYAAGNGGCSFNPVSLKLVPMEQHRGEKLARNVMRATELTAVNPGFVRVWLWKNLLRHINLYRSDTLYLRLNRSDLFGSRASNGLLVIRKDLRKITWKDSDLDRIRCGYAEIASRFEANGTTRFVTAIAPDKSSAYRTWLAQPDDLPASLLPALLNRFPVPDARLDRAMARAIAAGTRDVYMPDDTHWGSAGQKLAADAIFNLIVSEGLTQ
jgi:hypothetical protein